MCDVTLLSAFVQFLSLRSPLLLLLLPLPSPWHCLSLSSLSLSFSLSLSLSLPPSLLSLGFRFHTMSVKEGPTRLHPFSSI